MTPSSKTAIHSAPSFAALPPSNMSPDSSTVHSLITLRNLYPTLNQTYALITPLALIVRRTFLFFRCHIPTALTSSISSSHSPRFSTATSLTMPANLAPGARRKPRRPNRSNRNGQGRGSQKGSRGSEQSSEAREELEIAVGKALKKGPVGKDLKSMSWLTCGKWTVGIALSACAWVPRAWEGVKEDG